MSESREVSCGMLDESVREGSGTPAVQSAGVLLIAVNGAELTQSPSGI